MPVLGLIGRLSNHHIGPTESSYRISRRVLRRQHAVAQPCYVMRAACVSGGQFNGVFVGIWAKRAHWAPSIVRRRMRHDEAQYGWISTHVRTMLLGMIDRRPRSSFWPSGLLYVLFSKLEPWTLSCMINSDENWLLRGRLFYKYVCCIWKLGCGRWSTCPQNIHSVPPPDPE
jgi:hypothetical protein